MNEWGYAIVKEDENIKVESTFARGETFTSQILRLYGWEEWVSISCLCIVLDILPHQHNPTSRHFQCNSCIQSSGANLKPGQWKMKQHYTSHLTEIFCPFIKKFNEDELSCEMNDFIRLLTFLYLQLIHLSMHQSTVMESVKAPH
ncbi:hypothetical protein EGR_11026 [Echinococcus granulosus]|uniref:Uncharacterized protein n=1 Tax=Echinococcus granulosus TaxID=6210 RepID=W6UKU2_ECHGR|nr:hypothetical protein EGR_11026 [Echinococcus granulosus]EUB54114.1 hypothetical protein EGR_11026 [Echinococcus granulosus]